MAETSNENKRLRKFYDNLGTKYGVKGLPDYESFNGFMQDSDKRMKVYDSLKKKGHNVGTFEDFSRAVGTPIVADAPKAEKMSADSVQTIQPNNVDSVPSQPTDIVSEVAPKIQAPIDSVSALQTTEQPEVARTEKPRGQGLIFKPTEEEQAQQNYLSMMEQKTAPSKT